MLTFEIVRGEVPDHDSDRDVTLAVAGVIGESEGVIAIVTDPDLAVVGHGVDALVSHAHPFNPLAVFEGQAIRQVAAGGSQEVHHGVQGDVKGLFDCGFVPGKY